VSRTASLALAVSSLLLATASARGERSADVDARVSVCFSPGGECMRELIREIDAAHTTIRVQAVLLTVKPLVKSLIRAHERGVDVAVILGRKLGQKPRAPDACQRFAEGGVTGLQLANAGIPVFIDDQSIKTAHNKLTVIDDELVIGGSFNYTYSADKRNAENMTFIRSRDFAREYLENWRKRREASAPIFRPAC
jgi:phosphatidylserine/phosphatidylglycerophosphate/cardiolipin synthase-like enzyme